MRYTIFFNLLMLLTSLQSERAIAQFNLDFEDWTTKQGIENPNQWKTNNRLGYISVSKSADTYSGDFSAVVESNGFPFEGPGPGDLLTTLDIPNIEKIYFYIKVDSILSPGRVYITSQTYKNGTVILSDTLIMNQITTQWQLKHLNITSNNQTVDSVELYFSSQTISNSVINEGYAKFHLDGISINYPLTLESVRLNKEITISPNPVNKQISIEYSNGIDITHIEIIDPLGKVVRQYNSDSKELDVTNILSGIYILHINTRQGNLSKKIMIE